ncbi:MAG: MBL fold metallo-hydrolase [Prevotellaceae bacterium]|jgi:metallo-beta-lactamase family protein|nr:MBL fold metallo-hydrolase [Prevotellaceae bacterium]
MQIEFLGATREVTGSKFLITTKLGKKILLDCGMFQGKGMETDSANRNLGFDPKQIDHLILSHAHIDHSGLIPYMYRQGFRGSIICTAATRSLCTYMLLDSAGIQELDAKYYNRKAAFGHVRATTPLYDTTHAQKSMELFITTEFNRRFYIDNEISVKFFATGHLLGAGCAVLDIVENGKTIRVGYTGDIGRQKSSILSTPKAFPQCDYIITESTYGNRIHEPEENIKEQLCDIVYHTCVEKRGKLIIPSFAVGRTQDILYILNELYNEQKLPPVKIFVDSPLAVNATTVFSQYTEYLNDNVKNTMLYDDDPFNFNSVSYIKDAVQSKKINKYRKPCVIISASGMLEAGRVKHHVANNIMKPSTTILMVGYCSPTSLGSRIQAAGLKKISIFGSEIAVRAEIRSMEAFSGHGDYREMIKYLKCQNPNLLKNIFLVHGEYNVQEFYRQQLQSSGFRNIIIPQKDEKYILNDTEALKIK